MIRIYARNVEEDFARGVGRTDASWDAVITQLAGIIEKYITKTKNITNSKNTADVLSVFISQSVISVKHDFR